LSPSNDPPVVPDDGSTASTATRCDDVRAVPNFSMKVDFPAPGGPDNPILKVESALFL
jgi:hypothetical protein